jgi:triacylglycerol lipase
MHAGISAVLAAAILLCLVAAGVVVLVVRGLRRRARPGLPEHARPALPPQDGPAPAPPAAESPEPPAPESALAAAEAPEPEPPPEQPPGEGAAPLPAAPLALRPAPSVPVSTGKRSPTRYPVVLAHGFGGFGSFEIRGRRLAYFRGVSERLRASGVDVHVVRVSPFAPIAARAQQLAAQIERLGADRVNIVAHSMGGLDARYAIACLGMAPRIASLTTIGTPHRGTPLADLAGVPLLWGALRTLPGLRGALRDLSPRRMAAFNLEVDDAPGVAYGCVVTAARHRTSRVNALLLPGYLFLRRRAGENDGVVPASSQHWGAIWGEIDADHWGAVGWSSAFDAAAFYEQLAIDLGQRGF